MKDINKLPAKSLLTPREVAKFFSVTLRTVYNWCEEGKLRYTKLGAIIRIYRFSVIEMIKDGDNSTEPPPKPKKRNPSGWVKGW